MSGLNVNASAFIPSPVVAPSQEPPVPSSSTGNNPVHEHDATSEATGEPQPQANEVAQEDEDYDADLEEVMNALEEIQEEQVHREVEAQLMQEMAEAGLDDFFDDDSSSTASDYNRYSQETPPGFRQNSSAPPCKFAPTCRAGSRACKFSHEHLGFCKFGSGCRNPSCNYNH